MAGTIVNTPVVQFFDNNGNPLAGGKITTYLSNTTTPESTWQNEALSTLNTNPIVLNSRGEATIWLTPDVQYTFVLTDANDNLIQTVNDIYGGFQAVNGMNASLINYTPAGTGAVATTVEAKLQESVSILDYIPIAEHAAIKAGTSTYNCSPAFNAAIAAAPTWADNVAYSQSWQVNVPPGKYFCASTIQIERAVLIKGANPSISGNTFSISTIEFAQDVSGFSVQRFNTSVSGKGGDSAGLENLTVIQKNPGVGTVGDGFRARARFFLKNVTFFYWPTNGVRVIASAGSGGSTEGNANNFRIENVTSSFGSGNGFYFSGADANAGTIIGCDASANSGYGFREESFLGNSYLGCHSADNTLGGYYVPFNNNARNVFVGCYDESGFAACEINSTTSVVIGGLYGSGFNASTTAKMLGDSGLVNTSVGTSTLRSTGKFTQVDITGRFGIGTENPGESGSFGSFQVLDMKGPTASAGGFFIQRTSDNSAETHLFTAGGATPAVTLSAVKAQRLDLATTNVTRLSIDPTPGHVTPGADNTQNLGSGSMRFATVFAGTSAINTSDSRQKQQDRPLNEREKAVAIKAKHLLKAFKFNDAVAAKGDRARIHFGIYAQELKAAFESEGLVAEKYAVLCYDEWDEQQETFVELIDEEGNPTGKLLKTQEYRPAGNRYGVRYEELMAFILAAL